MKLNLIKPVWSQKKGHIANENFHVKLADVETLTPAAPQLGGPKNCLDYVRHVAGVEEQMWYK